LSLHNTLTARKEQQQRQAQACKQALRHACALACPGKPACHACRARERACTCTKHACGRTAFRYTGGYAGIHAGLCSRCMPTKQCACCMLHVAWRLAVHVCQDHSEPRSAVTFILRRCAACCPAPCTIQSPASAAEPSTRPARGAPLHKQLRAQPGPDRVCAHAKCTYHAQVRSIRHTAWQRPWPHRGRTRRLTRWTTPLTCDVPQAVQKGCSRRARTRERMSNMKQHEHEAMRLFCMSQRHDRAFIFCLVLPVEERCAAARVQPWCRLMLSKDADMHAFPCRPCHNSSDFPGLAHPDPGQMHLSLSLTHSLQYRFFAAA